MRDIRELLPQSKFDTEMTDALVRLGYPAVMPILPESMEWLQDMNWPVAGILAPFLAGIGLPLLPEVGRVLATDDVWRYWVLREIVAPSPPLASALRTDLIRLATAPTAGEEDGVSTQAQEILANLES